MSETGGSVESVTLAGRTYAVAADADVQQKVGGFENEIQANGDGSARQIKTRVPWGLADITLSIDPENGDLEFLQDLSNAGDFFPVTISEVSGAIWQGNGQISGEVQRSLQATTASLSLMGTGTLTLQ